jgi:hypothetical protein
VRRAVGVVLLASLLAPAGANGALPRSTVDRLDEVRGPQVHVVYAVPADGADRRLDETGALEGSVGSFQGWLAGETGGANLRLDTYQGSLDVSFFRLTATDATVASRGAFVREAVQEELQAAGFNRPDRIYAVYYDGSSTYACGGAFWPPQLNGNAIVMYLRGRPPGAVCETNPFAAATSPPGYWEYAMLHDILHGLGMVPTCAPHHHLAGHVSDFANDLMWAGSAPWQFPARLDIGRDDYYGHGRSDCADLARSPYLTSNPPPPPVLAVSSFTVPTRIRPGRVVEARLRVTLDGAAVAAGSARCTARLGTRALPALSSSFTASSARCRWRIPLRSAGRRFQATVRATVESQSVSRSLSRVVR